MIMKLKKYFVFFICLILFFSCASNSKKKEDKLNIQVEQLSYSLAHLRLEQGLNKESSAFASRGLLNKNASSWEILLLKIYSTND